MSCNPLLLNGGPGCFNYLNTFQLEINGAKPPPVTEAGGESDKVDGVATILFGVMASVHLIWSIVLAVQWGDAGNTIMNFDTWRGAGFSAQFLCSWIFKGIQVIMWPIAYTSSSAAHAYVIYTSITLFIDSSVGLLSIIFWVLSVTVENNPIEGDFLSQFAVTISVNLIILVHDFIAIENLRGWYTFKMSDAAKKEKCTDGGKECTSIEE